MNINYDTSKNTEIIVPSTNSDVAVSDSATLTQNTVESVTNPNYYVDDDGVKRYTISAVDAPDLGD